jgi:hypothetical protein
VPLTKQALLSSKFVKAEVDSAEKSFTTRSHMAYAYYKYLIILRNHEKVGLPHRREKRIVATVRRSMEARKYQLINNRLP